MSEPKAPHAGRLPRGRRFGRYEVLDLLGAGGMGEVYRARDTSLSREVALKILTGEATRDSVRFRRFQTEAQASAALSHPNIVSVYDVGEEGDTPYIVSELVEGTTLAGALARGPFPTRRLLDLAVGIAEGLAAAHARGIVHRDLKPANVLLTAGGVPKIADFGLAKHFRPSSDSEGSHLSTLPDEHTAEGTILGTVGYMSPEQAKGEPADFRSDQFSLGSILYEMATGKRAFQRSSLLQTLAAIVQEEPEQVGTLNPKTPAPLRWIVERCLAKEPKARYAATEDLARDLVSVRQHISELPAPTTAQEVTRNLARDLAAVRDHHSEASGAGPAQATEAVPRAKRFLVPAILGAGIFLALLVAAGWLSRRYSDVASKWPGIPFKARDWVLVAGFENRTGQPLLDGTLEYALGHELNNSRYVNVAPQERIGDTLRLMRKPLDTPVDAAIGREICLRDGDIRALITGRIERLGSKYLLSVELVDPSQGASIASAAEEAASEEQLLPATRRISDEVRALLGENPPSIREGKDKLVKVTTPSLRALQLYSQADALIAWGNYAVAEELLKHAMAEDPEFASGHIHLAWTMRNQSKSKEEFLPEAETAFRLSTTTTEREQYFIRGSYYQLLGHEERAITAYQALLTLYPDHYWGTGNLATCYESQGRFRDASELRVRRADIRPKGFQANFGAAFALAPLDPVRSRIYVRRARELVSPAVMEESPNEVAWLELVPAAEHWLDGNLTEVLQVADGLAAKIDSLSDRAREGFADQVLPVYLELGRLESAARCIQKIPDSIFRHDLLSRVAFIKGDAAELKQHLEAFEEGPLRTTRTRVSLLARVGLLPQAARLLTKFEKCCSELAFVRIMRGEVALARGQVSEGIFELEEGTRRYGEGLPYFFVGSESLATALRKKGNLARAVEVLERASARRPWAAFHYAGQYWLRNRNQLAQLYRESGRENEARTIEAELRKLLALADPDHPIRRELERLRGS